MSAPSRRYFLLQSAALAVAPASQARVLGPWEPAPRFVTRGVVLLPEDLTLRDWPERAKQAGLTTLALHHGRSVFEVIKFVHSEAGQDFLARAQKLGLEIEYELHAMSDLLPRWLFEEDRNLFRMNEGGERVADWNLCIHAPRALEIAAENAVAMARLLCPTTGQYFYWGDDGRPGCRCPKCRALSDSEQALVLENHLVRALRRYDPRAQLAHLAYSTTLAAPRQVKPDEGVFLEYAPIARRYDIPCAEQMDGRDGLSNLDANLRVFTAGAAQVLEYWLDASRFSNWKRPARKLPWNRDVFLADLQTYAARGIRRITTFACYLDADYRERYGEPEAIEEYGAGLRGFSLMR